jgi:hypothetical protein
MIAPRLASYIAAPVGGRAWSLLKRRVAALAATCAVGISCMAAPIQAATVARIEIGSADTTAFLLGGQLAGGELLALLSSLTRPVASSARV